MPAASALVGPWSPGSRSAPRGSRKGAAWRRGGALGWRGGGGRCRYFLDRLDRPSAPRDGDGFAAAEPELPGWTEQAVFAGDSGADETPRIGEAAAGLGVLVEVG